MSTPFDIMGSMFPKSDSPGRDLDRIPRFPESIRLNFTVSENNISVQYMVRGSNLDDVTEFYKEEMQKIGWNLEREEAIPGMEVPFTSKNIEVVFQGGSWNLSFESDKGESAYLEISEGGMFGGRAIMIVADYSSELEAEEKPEGLPESFKRLIPDIPQFPDSSRISQSRGVGGMLMEEYIVLGNRVFEVLEFYHDNMKDWEILQENVNPREASLTMQREHKNKIQLLLIFIDYRKPNTSLSLQLNRN
jgi:hypothetical protein